MTDDIVARLRANCETTDCVNVRSIALVKCDNCEAADEIERLREACDYYHKMCSMIADKNFTANEEIHRLKLILTHICDVWGSDLLSIIDEMNRFKKEVV